MSANATTTIRITHPKQAEAPVSPYRVSTKTLELADNVLKVAAGCAMYCLCPVETIKGALCGAIVRLMLCEEPNERDEANSRANRTASICFTGMATAFAFATPGPHTFAPLVLGFSASADGAYGLLRKFVS